MDASEHGHIDLRLIEPYGRASASSPAAFTEVQSSGHFGVNPPEAWMDVRIKALPFPDAR